MGPHLFKLSFIVCLFYNLIGPTVAPNPQACSMAADPNKPTAFEQKLRTDIENAVGSNRVPWINWTYSRPGLDGDGIVQAIKYYFVGIFSNPQKKNIVHDYRARKIDYDAETYVFVVMKGGNSLDGLMAAIFLWLEGKQIAGFKCREETKEEREIRKEREDKDWAAGIAKTIVKYAVPGQDEKSLAVIINATLTKTASLVGGTAAQKQGQLATHYQNIAQDITSDLNSFVNNPTDTGNEVQTYLNDKMKKENAGLIVEVYVESLLKLMKTLNVEIFEQDDKTTEAEIHDHFKRYTNIIAALDAMNGAGKLLTAIFKKAYMGLFLLRDLKAGNGRDRHVIIIGVDMSSFEDGLFATNVEIDAIADETLREEVRKDRDERVVKADIVVTINAFRSATVPLMGSVVYYLVIPAPVNNILTAASNNLTPAPFHPKVAWVPTESEEVYDQTIFGDIRMLANYYQSIVTGLPTVF